MLAIEPVVTHLIYDVDFQRLRGQHPEVAEVLIALLSEHVRRLSSQLLDALFLPAESRVRKRLLELTERYDESSDEVVILAAPGGSSRPGGYLARDRQPHPT